MRVTAGLRPIADGPLFATGRWLAAMRDRVPGLPYTFELDGAVLHGTVVRGAHPGEPFDLPYILTADPAQLPLSEAARAARRRFAGSPAWTPHLVVMLPGYECHPLGPAARDGATLGDLVDEIVAWSRAEGLRAVAFLYTTTPELQQVLGRRGFARIPLSYSCELSPGVRLPAKRRSEARRELRRLAEAGVRLRVSDISRPVPGMVDLKCLHSRKYGGAADPAAVAHRLAALCDGGALLFSAEHDDHLVGYALFIPHRETWYCVSTARWYGSAGARHTYFATVFYEPARHAAEQGVTRLHYGQGSWRAKLSRGCRAVELPAWVLALDPALEPVVEWSARTTELSP
ncbi:GNAT family N-acetyltransferase [Nonomuraea sp. NPDC003727]